MLFYTSKDGTRAPLFVTHKKGIKLNGKNPLLLYGYGGFNVTYKPHFLSNMIPFMERGGIYVHAVLRGGGEYGEQWHVAGTKLRSRTCSTTSSRQPNTLLIKATPQRTISPYRAEATADSSSEPA